MRLQDVKGESVSWCLIHFAAKQRSPRQTERLRKGTHWALQALHHCCA